MSSSPATTGRTPSALQKVRYARASSVSCIINWPVALPSKPIYTIALSDADASGSLAFLKQKLGSTGIDIAFSAEQTKCVRRLGGRASDLESVC